MCNISNSMIISVDFHQRCPLRTRALCCVHNVTKCWSWARGGVNGAGRRSKCSSRRGVRSRRRPDNPNAPKTAARRPLSASTPVRHRETGRWPAQPPPRPGAGSGPLRPRRQEGCGQRPGCARPAASHAVRCRQRRIGARWPQPVRLGLAPRQRLWLGDAVRC